VSDTGGLDEALQAFVGLELGPPVPAPDAVNVAMIRHWCDAIGDSNPVYTDPDAAARSVHGGIVAPPTMLQAWVMHGLNRPPTNPGGPYDQMNALLFSRGFTSVVATNSDQTYHRYLRPGDRLTMRSTIESISPEKSTALGNGHFVTTRQDYVDADGELVGTMIFRIIRFRPRERPAAAPPRPRPGTTPDNQWWFDALLAGRLEIQRCAACGRLRHPPGPMCPACRSLAWDTVAASGNGSVHSHATVHHPQVPGFEYPLAVLLVDLDEGVRMVVNADPEVCVAIGEPVRLEVRTFDPDLALPVAVSARPAGPEGGG
jgi:uncharacterized OB-fold protein/acyl dehydratase